MAQQGDVVKAEHIIETAVGEWHAEIDPDLSEYVLWALRKAAGAADGDTLGDSVVIAADGTVGRLEVVSGWRFDCEPHAGGTNCDDFACDHLYRVVVV